MNLIEALLRREIGLDAASVGASLLERTLRLRLKALGLTDLHQYRTLLATSPAEWEELLEAVVVTETWFFRDPEAFHTCVQLLQQLLPRSSLGVPIRLLSVPCATGEEPYSLAMALLDAGVPPARFTIDAVDLSARALAGAQSAIYGKNSFRGRALEFRDRHFGCADGGYQLHSRIRDCVTFQRGNLLGERAEVPNTENRNLSAFRFSAAPYDFIFCRNLLIYFDRATQAQALRRLHQLLAPGGVLFVGPAELPLVAEHGFTPAAIPMAFACRKTARPPSSVPLPYFRSSKSIRKFGTPETEPASGIAPVADSRNNPVPTGRSTVNPTPDFLSSKLNLRPSAKAAEKADLNAARALADAGKLAEAEVACQAQLAEAGPSAAGYYLLGLITEARTEPEEKAQGSRLKTKAHPESSALDLALNYYRKALYLEPEHYETLMQLSLLSARVGDARGARGYRRRAERCAPVESMNRRDEA